MCNAVKFLVLIASAAALWACSSDKSRHEAAASLVAEAKSLTDAHQYDSALVVLDTLNVKYRDCIKERKEGTIVRLTALGALSRDSLASDEMQLRAVETTVDRLAPLFRKIELEGTDGYFVDKDIYTGKEMNTTGIQARIDEDGYCFVIANISGRKIGLNRIEFGDIATAPAPSIEIEGPEIMSVSQEAAMPLLKALSDGEGKATLTLAGTKGNIKINISAKDRDAAAKTLEYAMALQQKRKLQIRIEKLNSQISKLSDQLANQIPDPANE